MRPSGITSKLMMLALLPSVLMALLLSFYFISLQVRTLGHGIRNEGALLVTQLAPLSEYSLITGNKDVLRQIVTSAQQRENVSWVGVRDLNGHMQYQAGSLRTGWLALATQPDADHICANLEGSIIFCAPIQKTRLAVNDYAEEAEIASEQAIIGWVFVEISSAANAQKSLSVIMQSLLLTTVLLVLSSLGAMFLGYRIARPIIELTDTVQQVSRGNLSVHTEASGYQEVQLLAEGINSMIEALASSREGMQQRINAATAMLRDTLFSLEQKNRDLDKERLRAEAASHAKGQFLANMSHEIRTPLNGILGMLKLLKQSNLQAEQRTYITALTVAAEALHSLLSDILDLSRIEAGKMPLREHAFSPRQLLEDVALMLASSFHDKGLNLICHPSSELPAQVCADSLRLRQVLINLLDNALKFTHSGSVTVRAQSLSTAEKANHHCWLRFEVEDTGIGIPDDKQQEIFDSFTQIDNSFTRRHPGSGLGISIARELVALMGGNMGVHSTEGKGSLFWFELPCKEVAAAPRPTAPDLAGHAVFVVQAAGEERQAIKERADELGLELELSEDGADLVERLRACKRPAAVLLVESSPEPQHIELARRLRAEAADRLLSLCHATYPGGASDADVFDCRLSKPITLEPLRQWVNGLRVAAAQTDAGTRLPSMPQIAPLRILVVEDDRINALVIQRFLAADGHHVTWLENGLQALETLVQEPAAFDLVFMDVRMPELDGMETTRRWRAAEPADQHLPIIALTANATLEDKEQCLAAGMDEFLPKPVDPALLQAVLARYG